MFRRDTSRGQSMVEFALILPILMFLLMGFFDLGRVVLSHDALSHAAREAARYAIVHGGTISIYGGSLDGTCPVGPLPAGVTPPPATSSCPYPSPSTESIRREAREQAAAAGSIVTVEVCYGAGCVGDTNAPGATNVRGTPVTVTVHSTVDMSAASLIGFSSFTTSSSSTMLVNH
jgi:TadE-like protein